MDEVARGLVGLRGREERSPRTRNDEKSRREIRLRDLMRVLRGKKALVTGAASGIGRSIALALAREAVDLYLVDIDDLKIDGVVREARSHGIEVRTARCDLARPEEVTALVESVLAAWGRLNILVNNAGVAHRGPTHEMSSDGWNRLLAGDGAWPAHLIRADEENQGRWWSRQPRPNGSLKTRCAASYGLGEAIG